MFVSSEQGGQEKRLEYTIIILAQFLMNIMLYVVFFRATLIHLL